MSGLSNLLAWDGSNWTPLKSSTTGELNIYNTRLQSGENQSLDTQGVSTKFLASQTYAPSTLDTSPGNEASSISKASAGLLLGAYGTIIGATATGPYYFQLFNTTTVPADGVAPFLVGHTINHITGTPTQFYFDIAKISANAGIYFSNGICWCFSSTLYTKTITAAIGAVQIVAI